MPLYDFKCEECGKLVEDEFFKIVDDKHIKCCDIQMKQVILKAPGLRDPGGIGQKWVNDGYQMANESKTGETVLRIVKERWEKGKNVIRSDAHDNSRFNTTLGRIEKDHDDLIKIGKEKGGIEQPKTIFYDKHKMK